MIARLPPAQREAKREELGRPLAAIAFSVRTINGLEEAGIYTVGLLLMCKPSWLLTVPNIGEKTLAEIFKGLESIGYSRGPASNECSGGHIINNSAWVGFEPATRIVEACPIVP